MGRSAARGIVDRLLDAMVQVKLAMTADSGVTPTHGTGLAAQPAQNAVGTRSAKDSEAHAARVRRDFTIQLGGLFALRVWVTLLGISYLSLYR